MRKEAILCVQMETAGYTEAAAVHDIVFHVHAGELVGLIGENGAGKSTTIKAVLGLLPHRTGTVELGDYAYVPEQPVYYDYLTLWEHIELAAAARELESWEARAEELLAQFKLQSYKHQYMNQFSKGTKQKAMLVLAFLGQPPLYIVDEPFVGLDPTAVRTFLQLLAAERERGAAVLLCTHVLDTAEKLCERLLLISKGTLLADGTAADLRRLCSMPEASLLDCFYALVEQHG